MEHLDLAGVIGTPTMWSMPAFDQQDAIYLSSSRQMLEPILEETSEDEERAQHSWNQYEQSTSFWSSAESETGSVIRVEVNKDPDSISERDFACPAKRARRSDDFLIGGQLASAQPASIPASQAPPLHISHSFDDTVLLRRSQRSSAADYNETHSNSLERFLAYEACTRDSWGTSAPNMQQTQRNSTGSRRFVDDFSDSDSLSYNSLSRSSSLIQFESLERQLQLQEQHASMTSLGNSSPSLLSFDGANSASNEEGARSGNNSGNNSRRGSQSSLLKRFEAADGRLHQTYFDLDKLNFDDDKRVLFGAGKANVMMEATVGEVKSDSESSTSSSSDSSSGNSILTASKPSAEDLTDPGCAGSARMAGRIMAFQRVGKSSAENLSEDSGYCEPSTLRRAKSKSIPKNFEKFCEEEEEFQQFDYAAVDENLTKTATIATAAITATLHSKTAATANNHNNNSVNSSNSNIGGIAHCNSATKSPIIHYVAVGHDICQPKINDATFVVLDVSDDDDNDNDAMPPRTPPPLPPSSSPPPLLPSPASPPASPTSSHTLMAEGEEASYYERVKNSPTREAALALEQRRSLAHSPSPVSSDASGSSCGTTRSSASASTCASAASFTWLPTPQQQQLLQQPYRIQQQQQQQQKQQQLQFQLERTLLPPLAQRWPLDATSGSPTLENFRPSLRNSLPDIRDALSSETLFSSTICSANLSERKGYVLERTVELTAKKTIPTNTATTLSEKLSIDNLNLDIETKNASVTATGSGSGLGSGSGSESTSGSTAAASSTTSSPRDSSRSDVTDGDSTPESARKRNIASSESAAAGGTGGGGGGGVGVGASAVGCGAVGCYVNRRRIASVPSELNRLGRKKRTTRHRYSKSSPEDDTQTSAIDSNSNSSAEEYEDDFFDDAALKIRRSCSWSERRERNLQRFDAAAREERQRNSGEAFGYMNASYQDLTRLDYNSKRPLNNQANLKRASGISAETESESNNMDTPKSGHSADYENIICKGNFLLDELSKIYDRNASILNDKPVVDDAQLLHLPLNTIDSAVSSSSGGEGTGSSPRPPPRQRKHSNSSYSDVESGGDDVVQHVRLVIRKPNPRQKHARKSEATHSLVSEPDSPTSPIIAAVLGKTFDQDPTNLRTSYAQSLEKCNFDPKELSNTELDKLTPKALPKRRFHSQATTTKQRNMVSSTPNLNAFDPHADEADDDMYVSSAHTSMHQLPQATAQKPLGILLPAGSRTSFSKEVSFCPVVSQYSWQEQSSEEYNEQQQQQQQQQTMLVQGEQQVARAEEDTDDELLDNADATVIYNTRENEMIAARYAAEEQRKAQSSQPIKSVAFIRAAPVEKLRAAAIFLRERETTLDDDSCEEEERKTSHEYDEQSASDEKPDSVNSNNRQVTIGNKHSWVSVVEAPTRSTAIATVTDGIGAHTTASHKSTIIDGTTTAAARNVNINVTKRQTSEQHAKNNSQNRGAGNVNVNDSTSDSCSGDGSAFDEHNEPYARPISIHLPILSEPPTNRAHHILYASQQMLDNFQRREREDNEREHNAAVQQQQRQSGIGAGFVGERVIIDGRRAKSVGNLSGAPQAGYYHANIMSGNAGASGAIAANNNNDLMKTKFKDEKHPSSKGFLSRFAHGLRFSLRRSKKKQLQQQQQQQQQQLTASAVELNGSNTDKIEQPVKQKASSAKQKQQLQQHTEQQQNTGNANKNTADYVYIPLKGPLPAGVRNSNSNNEYNNGNSATLPANFSPADTKVGAKAKKLQQQQQQHSPAQNSPKSNNSNNNSTANNSNSGEPLVTGKPPLPHRYGTLPANSNSSSTIITKYFGNGLRRSSGGGSQPQQTGHAHKSFFGSATNFKTSTSSSSSSPPPPPPPQSRSKFYTDFLEAERAYYSDTAAADESANEAQLETGMQANGRAADAVHQNDNDNDGHDVPYVYDNKYNGSGDGGVSGNDSLLQQPKQQQQRVQQDTIMLLTGAGAGAGVGAGASANAAAAPTNTTMSGIYLQQQQQQLSNNNNNKHAAKIGLIETNLDTHETVISGKTRSLVDIAAGGPQQTLTVYGGGKRLMQRDIGDVGDVVHYDDDDDDDDDGHVYGVTHHDDDVVGGAAGGRSVVAGGMGVVVKSTTANGSQIASVRRPHKSMEFLLDKENQKTALPPENELQKSHEHNPAALSEHQLRVQASLQRLNIPDWFRQYNQNTSRSPDGSNTGAYKPGNFTRKRTTESGRWAGLNSKTTSLSSLGSQRSDRSPLLLSPSAHSHHGGQSTMVAHQQASGAGGGGAIGHAANVGGVGAGGGGGGGASGAFSRWSTSHLNSSQTSPSVSQRGSFTRGDPINSSFISVASGQSSVIRSSFRQPYLGWRSQEKLSQRTPHERLASSLLAQQQRTSPTQRTPNAATNGDSGKLQPVTPEIQSSIKEVTSAIVHYVNDQTNQQRSRSASPNSRKCWLESSFVGIRPLDSPQTPIIESNTANAFGSVSNAASVSNSCNSSNQYNNYNYNYNYNYNNTASNSSVGTTSSFHSSAAAGAAGVGATATAAAATPYTHHTGVGITTAITTNPHVLRMNGLSIVGGGESTILI